MAACIIPCRSVGGVTAADAPGFPATLGESGSYVLTSNPNVSDPNTAAIEINATRVHSDLDLFSVSGPVTDSAGTLNFGSGISAGDGSLLRGQPVQASFEVRERSVMTGPRGISE